jgi:hypothetical protein
MKAVFKHHITLGRRKSSGDILRSFSNLIQAQRLGAPLKNPFIPRILWILVLLRWFIAFML